MTRLTKYEKETIILTSEGDDFWNVLTYNLTLKRKLKAFAQKYPEHCRLEREDSKLGSVSYNVDKGGLSVRLNAPYSAERRQAISDEAKKHGFESGISSKRADDSLKQSYNSE